MEEQSLNIQYDLVLELLASDPSATFVPQLLYSFVNNLIAVISKR